MHTADACQSTLRTIGEKFAKPQVYLMNLPSLPAGQWAIAWCSASAQPVPAKPVAQPWHAQLRCWTPALQSALFCLPRNTQQQLGLAPRG